jgi:hypothetical protein
MLLRRFTNYLLMHRGQALVLTVLSAVLSLILPLFGLIAISIALLLTLLKGAKEGAVFTFAASFPYLFGFFAGHQVSVPLVVWAGAGAALLTNVLSYIFALMLARRINFSQLIQIVALMGVLIVSVVHLVYPDVADWWAEGLQAYYSQASKALNLLNTIDTKTQTYVLDTINTTKYYATGFLLAALLTNAIFQLIVARWWQATVFSPGSLKRELHHIRLNSLAGFLFVMGLVFAYLGNIVVLDIMPIAYVLFSLAGLSLVHYAFGLVYSSTRWFWLMIFYFTLIVAMPISMIFVSMLALLDVWFNLRRKLKKSN